MSFSIVTASWFRFLLPIGLVALLTPLQDTVTSIIIANTSLSMSLPYILFSVAIILSHVFKHSRCAMIASAMLLTYWVIQNYLQSSLTTGTTLLELCLLAFALPAACFAIYMFKDSAVRSPGFVGYLVVLALLVLWSQLTLKYLVESNFLIFEHPVFFIEEKLSRLPVVLVLYLTVLVLLCAILLLKNNRIVDTAVYSSLLLGSITLIFFHVSYVSSVLFSLAGLLLLVYLLSASYELAFNDRLTGIPGRLALESDLKHLGRKYSLAMLDIDHFKSFNDTYGHDTGDDVLKLVASKLRKVRGGARVYRYGGEEFTILFKGKLAEEALDHLEDLRRDIAEYELTIRNISQRPRSHRKGTKKRGAKNDKSTVSLTISIGLADSYDEKDVNRIIKAADQALYEAKGNGRNCTIAARQLTKDFKGNCAKYIS
ncbi:GGDEF domain-containing protein [Vibrio ponticus]|uniref:diguanylate cyclase n=1 Tax=Vibrio ponticus TaxID=265668 RepID=A0A3N3DV13_9VIBR|nr:GGDEF domain-containing protein [Vibrio ponticus]ROV58317.1 GGDEF domain-containing protein [Vibrio ponticus]